MSDVKKNFLYNIIYQILVLIIPLITAPYLSRTLGVESIGIYSYTYSIVYYFMLFCLLGVNNYGNRAIAKVRNDKNKLSKTFFEIYFFQLLMGLFMIILYCIYLFFISNKYHDIFLIHIIFILSSMLDINWFFFGLEKFKITVTRNSIIKLLTVILIFIFVKNSSDLWIYTLIMASTTLISQLSLWMLLKKFVIFTKINFKDVIKHIKPNLLLFIPVIAVSLYKIMDKIMLGILSSVSEVGYYEQAEKIINIPLSLIMAFGTVMLPRASNILANGKLSTVREYINKSISAISFLSFAMCFGLVAIGYNFAPIYFGETFQKTGIIIMLLAITIPFISIGTVVRTQYLIPSEMEKEYIITALLGAAINLIINFIFIPKYGSIGACFGTIAAEFLYTSYMMWVSKKDLEIKKYLKNIIPFFYKSMVMFLLIYFINFIKINILIKIVLQVFIGGIIYCLLNWKYICSIIDIKSILNKIRKKIKA